MALLLKEQIDEEFISELQKALSHFSEKKINSLVLPFKKNEGPTLELKERIRLVSTLMHSVLEKYYSYKKELELLKKVAQHLYKKNREEGKKRGLALLIFPDFVEVFGKQDLKESLKALEFFTSIASAEFAIRAFLTSYPDETKQQMLEWSISKNEHLRRLSSEGSRPRLPWSYPLKEFIADPTWGIVLLTSLKSDSSLYVRKSVANHLNDISKDHPQMALDVASSWKTKNNSLLSQEEQQYVSWVIKHGLRTLLKKGDVKALAIIGIEHQKTVNVGSCKLLKKRIKLGHFLEFKVEVNYKESSKKLRLPAIALRLEYAISTPKGGRKVFMLKQNKFAPEQFPLTVQKKHHLKPLTTRKLPAGKYHLEVIANGVIQWKDHFFIETD